MAGRQVSNLQTHIKTHHATIYIKFKKEEASQKGQQQSRKRTVSEFGSSSRRTSGPMSKYIRTFKIISTTVMVKPAEVINGIIELITVNSQPFTLPGGFRFPKSFWHCCNRLRIDVESK